MTTCNDIDDLLLEGDSMAMQRAAGHAENCPACLEKLAAWNEITALAPALHVTWKSDLLWPRIERSLRAERRHIRPIVWQIAAVFLLVAVLGATVWQVRRTARQSAFDEAILRMTAVDEVERTERAHVAAIDKLEKLAAPQLENPVSPLMISYKEKLMMLDDAIAECESNIQRNRQNAHLRRQLLAVYSEKQSTLQELVREESHVSTP